MIMSGLLLNGLLPTEIAHERELSVERGGVRRWQGGPPTKLSLIWRSFNRQRFD
jgi:hypothetical protein